MVKKKRDGYRLSDLQLEIMKVLWQADDLSVADVRRSLPTGTRLAYTTVATLLRRMEDDGLIEHETRDRSYLYRPLVSADRVTNSMVGHVLNRVFEGSLPAMVSHLLSQQEVNPEESGSTRENDPEEETATMSAPSLSLWLEAIGVIAIGVAAIAAMAMVLCGRITSAAWSKTIRQGALVSFALLVLAESLVRFGQRLHVGRAAGRVGIRDHRSDLARRVAGLLSVSSRSWSHPGRFPHLLARCVGLGLAVLLVLGGTGWIRNNRGIRNVDMNRYQRRIAASILGATLMTLQSTQSVEPGRTRVYSVSPVLSHGNDGAPVMAIDTNATSVRVSALFVELPTEKALEILAGILGSQKEQLDDPALPLSQDSFR